MRLEELNPPYEGIDAERISQWVPPDAEVEPLHTVRMYLKNHPLLAERMRPLAWFLLDPSISSLDVRARELAVARTCGRTNCESQWGVHQAVYGEVAEITPEQRLSTVKGSPEDDVWSERDRVILRAVDELIDTHALSDEQWAALRGHLDEAQTLELLVLTGWYLLNCITTNVIQTPLEPFALRFPS
jgi:alkylhydroperoxidase family enzyme